MCLRLCSMMSPVGASNHGRKLVHDHDIAIVDGTRSSRYDPTTMPISKARVEGRPRAPRRASFHTEGPRSAPRLQAYRLQPRWGRRLHSHQSGGRKGILCCIDMGALVPPAWAQLLAVSLEGRKMAARQADGWRRWRHVSWQDQSRNASQVLVTEKSACVLTISSPFISRQRCR